MPGSDLKLHDGTATSHQQFLEDAESLCSTVTWDDTSDKVKWIYKVQDTPGTDLQVASASLPEAVLDGNHLDTYAHCCMRGAVK